MSSSRSSWRCAYFFICYLCAISAVWMYAYTSATNAAAPPQEVVALVSKEFKNTKNDSTSSSTGTISTTSTVPSNGGLEIIKQGADARSGDGSHYLKVDTPGWSCSNKEINGRNDEKNQQHHQSSDNKKLIFVHVFKTAGSSFRQFFDIYGSKCHKGVTTIISCSLLSSSSIPTTLQQTQHQRSEEEDEEQQQYDEETFDSIIHRDWKLDSKNQQSNKFHSSSKRCQIKHSLMRDTGVIQHESFNVSTAYLRNYTDIAIGHLPLGIHQNWVTGIDNEDDDEEKLLNDTVQYVTFFRDPFAKFVSGRLFIHPKWDFDEAVSEIKKRIHHDASKNETYNGYENYLLTPKQKDDIVNHDLSEDDKVRLIQGNILNMNVLVGVVEHMSQSLEMIQSIIDVNREMTDEFRKLDPKNLLPRVSVTTATATKSTKHNTSKEKEVIMRNQSKLSTSAIVQVLKEDEEIWGKFEKVLKYDSDLYDFALQIHEKQYEELKKRHGDKFSLLPK